MDQAHLPKPLLGGSFQIGLYDARNVARAEGVKIEVILDRYDDHLILRIGVGRGPSLTGHGQ